MISERSPLPAGVLMITGTIIRRQFLFRPEILGDTPNHVGWARRSFLADA